MAKKYYAVRKGRIPGIYTDWNSAKAQVDGVANEYKGFQTREEAVAYLNEKADSVTKSDSAALNCIVKRKMDRNPKTNGQIELEKRQQILDGVYIGSDEVGKGEPLRRLVLVSAYVDKRYLSKLKEIGADKDSKRFSNIDAREVEIAGTKLTDFAIFEECVNGVYQNEEYGITYAVYSVSNRKFNELHASGKNQNKILSELHNQVNYMLYAALKEQGIDVAYIVIDNYMGQYQKKFDTYLADYTGEKIMELPDTEVVFETKAESNYPAVACASIIGSYIEHLWQEKVRLDLERAGGDADQLTFGNTNSGIDREFRELIAAYGSLDASEVDIKHTSHYKRYQEVYRINSI